MTGRIIQNRGKIIIKDDRRYFLTIHPAATIYNQKLIDVLKKDMKKLVKTIADLKSNEASS